MKYFTCICFALNVIQCDLGIPLYICLYFFCKDVVLNFARNYIRLDVCVGFNYVMSWTWNIKQQSTNSSYSHHRSKLVEKILEIHRIYKKFLDMKFLDMNDYQVKKILVYFRLKLWTFSYIFIQNSPSQRSPNSLYTCMAQ